VVQRVHNVRREEVHQKVSNRRDIQVQMSFASRPRRFECRGELVVVGNGGLGQTESWPVFESWL
jgi:hypothetical protein